MRILEIGSGRNWQKWSNTQHQVTCVDRIYSSNQNTGNNNPNLTLIGMDIIPFLETYIGADFDKVIAHRVLEHFKPDTVLYVLYLLRQVTRKGGELEIIVPDFHKVITEFEKVDPKKATGTKFNRMMTMAHTEIFNEPNDPHQSIWTTTMAFYYLELEGYWTDVFVGYTSLDGRDWYLKIEAVRK